MSREIVYSESSPFQKHISKLIGDLEADEFDKIRGGKPRNPLVIEEPVDIITFSESPDFLNLKLNKRQKFALKVFYGLPLDAEDLKEIVWLEKNKGIKLPVYAMDGRQFRELVLVIGRRGGKTFMVSIIAAYEAYKLITKYDPQSYYNLPPDEQIYILNAATSGDQALVMFAAIKSRIRNCKWFEPYISKDYTEELRLFTKKDLEDNIKIREYNALQKYQVDRRKEKDGSIIILSTHSNSRSIRGKGAIVVIFDELAHFLDNQGNQSGSIVYDAVTPSTKTFGEDGKIISISSPWGKAGKFYELYELGISYDDKGYQKVDGMIVLQYSSWEFNPALPKESFRADFIKNPESARTEFGAEFADVANAAFNPMHIDRMVNANKRKLWIGNPNTSYFMTIDPAKSGDVFVAAWGHLEEFWEEIYEDDRPRKIKRNKVVIDGVHGWRASTVEDRNTGEIYRKDIDFVDIENFINDMSQNMNIDLVAFDQFSSIQMIQQLQRKGFTAFETPFTNKYKRQIYENFGELLAEGRVEIYGIEDNPDDWFLQQAISELKFVQRIIKGKIVSFTHPDSGPIQNDDFADAIVNLAWLLLSGGAATVTKRNNRGPMPGNIRPTRGSSLDRRSGLLSNQLAAAAGFNGARGRRNLGNIIPIDRLRTR